MNVGDMVKWYWHLDSSTWEATQFRGIIVDSRVVKYEHEEVLIFDVLDNLVEIIEVREDAPGLELIA